MVKFGFLRRPCPSFVVGTTPVRLLRGPPSPATSIFFFRSSPVFPLFPGFAFFSLLKPHVTLSPFRLWEGIIDPKKRNTHKKRGSIHLAKIAGGARDVLASLLFCWQFLHHMQCWIFVECCSPRGTSVLPYDSYVYSYVSLTCHFYFLANLSPLFVLSSNVQGVEEISSNLGGEQQLVRCCWKKEDFWVNILCLFIRIRLDEHSP